MKNAAQTALKTVETDPETEPADLNPREVREKAGLSQTEMAELMDMSPFGYQSWENGQRRPGGPARRLLKLIDADAAQVQRVLNG